MSTREYAKNLFSTWSDEDFCNQPVFDKLFFTVLNGQRAVNAAGIQPINFTRWRKAMRDGDRLPSIDELKASLLRMERRHFVFTDEDTGEVLIRSRIRNDGLEKQPTMFLGALRILAVVDSPKFAAVMLAELDRTVLPDVDPDTDYKKKLRAELARADSEARAHLKAQADKSSNPLAEPFEGGSVGESPGPSHRPTPGGSPRPGETDPTEGGSPGGSMGPPVSGSVSGSLTHVGGDLGGTHARGSDDRRCSVCHAVLWTGADDKPHPSGLCPDCRRAANVTQHDPDGEPPLRCKLHRDLPADTEIPDCGPCGNFAKAHDRWTDRQTLELANATAVARRNRIQADLDADQLRAAGIANCTQCDDDGRRAGGVIVCNHTPGQDQTNARGIAAVRAVLAGTGTDDA